MINGSRAQRESSVFIGAATVRSSESKEIIGWMPSQRFEYAKT
jgi:hypothetical protein